MSRIAVILPDLLWRTGVTSILERYFSDVEVFGFDTVGNDLHESAAFDCYFTDFAMFGMNTDFFLPRRAQCILLTNTTVDKNSGRVSENLKILSTTDTLENIVEQIELALSTNLTTEDVASNELSAREVQVLQLVVSGAINKEVADRLNISFNTVLTHRKNITAKLGIKTISGLTLYSLMNGYISADKITL